YTLNSTENKIFSETMQLLATDFKYTRYKPAEYYIGDRDAVEQEVQRQRNLAKFMKILIVKRLESSFAAFLQTLDRFIRSYKQVIAEFEKGHVFISKKYSGKILELLESDDQAGIEQLLDEDKAEKLDAANFKPEFIDDLRGDLKLLTDIQTLWRQVTRDPKWESFRKILASEPTLKNGKVIIFTESKETAEYLAGKIQAEVEPKVLLFTGTSPKNVRDEVIANFDAKSEHLKNHYRIIVTTDVLAEGVNLHRSNVVINYDIPWNPTRLIQRVGRVNRIDTTFDKIFTYNFFPTEEGNDLIKLREAAEAKIHAFIQMLGADARLLTDGEEIVSHDLFAKLNSKKTITGEDEDEETELKFLAEIRRVRDENPALFDRIKRLPRKARSTRTLLAEDVNCPDFPALLTYFRQGKLDKFFLSTPTEGKTQELDFLTAANLLKPADAQEPHGSIGRDFYELLDKNKSAFNDATTSDAELAESTHGGNTSDRFILQRLKDRSVSRCQKFTEDDELFIKQTIRLIENGMLTKTTSKKIRTALEKVENFDPLMVLAVLRRDIPNEFLYDENTITTAHRTLREVILSSYITRQK
ncbi:MAG: helicase-related protein, partial [Thermoguttaceae bacterium]